MENYKDGLHLIPLHMRAGVVQYIDLGVPGGTFQQAVFANDMLTAFGHADATNLAHMEEWASFLYNHAPRGCYGSPTAVLKWCDQGGLLGRPQPVDVTLAKTGTQAEGCDGGDT